MSEAPEVQDHEGRRRAGQVEIAKAHMTLDEIVDKVEEKEQGGVKRAKVRMKVGNSS